MKKASLMLAFMVAVFAISPRASASVVLVDIHTTIGSGSMEFLDSSGGLAEITSFEFETLPEYGSVVFTQDHLTDASFEVTGTTLTGLGLMANRCSPVIGTITDSCDRADHAVSDAWKSFLLVLDEQSALFQEINNSCPPIGDPTLCDIIARSVEKQKGDPSPAYSVSTVPIPAAAGLLIAALAALAGLGAIRKPGRAPEAA